MCLTGAIFMNVHRQLECLHFPCPHSSVSDPPSKLLRWVTPSPCLLQLLMLLQSFLDRQTKVSNSPGNFQTVYYIPLEEILSFTFCFLFFFNFSEPMRSADGAIFFSYEIQILNTMEKRHWCILG